MIKSRYDIFYDSGVNMNEHIIGSAEEAFDGRDKGDMKKALIISGITELKLHGMEDFSLRRVASRCGASCAAPYRHFKNKNDLIEAILSFIDTQKELFAEHVYDSFPNDSKRRFTEICISEIRFWMANPEFRYVMMVGGREGASRELLSSAAVKAINEYCDEYSVSPDARRKGMLTVKAVIYGMTQILFDEKTENTGEIFETARELIEGSMA